LMPMPMAVLEAMVDSVVPEVVWTVSQFREGRPAWMVRMPLHRVPDPVAEG
jgi:hypothetical protein